MDIKFKNKIVKKVLDYLGYDGVAFFEMCLTDYGDISPVIMTKYGMPHPVHFREGMQIRNFLRSLDETKHWNDQDFDNYWGDIIEEAISLCYKNHNLNVKDGIFLLYTYHFQKFNKFEE